MPDVTISSLILVCAAHAKKYGYSASAQFAWQRLDQMSASNAEAVSKALATTTEALPKPPTNRATSAVEACCSLAEALQHVYQWDCQGPTAVLANALCCLFMIEDVSATTVLLHPLQLAVDATRHVLPKTVSCLVQPLCGRVALQTLLQAIQAGMNRHAELQQLLCHSGTPG